ncbi:MAG: hypothetical protein R3272_09690 [Candidatus Promineifilaceae bacterium]|nr:hypothetical protein [Candidatus Promineifilaceae bacterium]
MSESTSNRKPPRNRDSWAKQIDRLSVGELPAEAINLNVHGRRPTSPLQGFGQLWQKTYIMRLEGIPEGADVTPAKVIAEWKANFASFWPEGNNFYGALQGIRPGEVAVLNLSVPGGGRLSTGVHVIYADDESFSFMTPEGHMFAGMITFSAAEDGEGGPVVQIQALIRASDPIYEATFRLGFGHKAEDEFWFATLRNLAAHFGGSGAPALRQVCVDRRVQWKEAKNVWQNAAVRTALYLPVIFVRRLLRRD